QLNPVGNVAVARVPLVAGAELLIDGVAVKVLDPVPAGHKVALRPIGAGEIVLRYGQHIGRAKSNVPAGGHIHTHNLSYEEEALQYDFPEGEVAIPAPPVNIPTFLGYVREDGRVGTRNYIAV